MTGHKKLCNAQKSRTYVSKYYVEDVNPIQLHNKKIDIYFNT